MLKIKTLIMAVGLALCGCGGEPGDPPETACFTVPDSLHVAQRQFILDCIEKANPKSDEEPEDWIMACEQTSYRVFGRLYSPNSKPYNTGLVNIDLCPDN